MPRKKNNKVLILKITLEDKEIAEEELALGTTDLARILTQFRQDIVNGQKNKFDKFFFGSSPETESPDSHNQFDVENKLSTLDEKAIAPPRSKNTIRLPWVKALYKKIVQRTHPDKYIDFPIKEIKEKFTKIYINTVEAYENNDIGLLLLCAYETEIDVKEPGAEKYLDDSIGRYKSRLLEVEKLIGYQWYHIPEINRLPFLKSYLARLGYKFNQKVAVEAIKKSRYIKRKIGKRPEKMSVKRKKIN